MIGAARRSGVDATRSCDSRSGCEETGPRLERLKSPGAWIVAYRSGTRAEGGVTGIVATRRELRSGVVTTERGDSCGIPGSKRGVRVGDSSGRVRSTDGERTSGRVTSTGRWIEGARTSEGGAERPISRDGRIVVGGRLVIGGEERGECALEGMIGLGREGATGADRDGTGEMLGRDGAE